METPPETNLNLADATKQIVQRLLAICDNRAELLMVEIQEERERILLAIGLALCAAAFGLLAGITLTAVIAIALGKNFLIGTLVVLTVIYAGVAAFLCFKLARLQQNSETLASTLDQLRKDRECLEKQLS